MLYLGLEFNTMDMSVTLPQEKLEEVKTLVHNWAHKEVTNINELRTLLGKLFYVTQCCPPARLFSNRMLDTIRRCSSQGVIHLSAGFCKDLAWFHHFLPHTNGVFLIHEDDRQPGPLFVYACTSGC